MGDCGCQGCCVFPHGKGSICALILALITVVFSYSASGGCYFVQVGASLTTAGPVIAPGVSAGWGLLSFEDATALSNSTNATSDDVDYACYVYTEEQLDEMDAPFRAARIFAMFGNGFLAISMFLLLISSCMQFNQGGLLAIVTMLLIGGTFYCLTFIFYASNLICGQYGCEFQIGSGLAIGAILFAFITAAVVAKLPADSRGPFREGEAPMPVQQQHQQQSQLQASQAYAPGTQTISETVMPDGTKKITKTTVNADGSKTVEETVVHY
jgi:hypothetical protein